ncbi:MAG TPA: Nramp family divalent metal transporter [Patescibacteria group bacterium]|nr:Nramp family divalent metal transporter [Patescibacteria group bacterium]
MDTKRVISFLKKLIAFSGPGYLVAVGYMDPGNWATDLAGGSKFGYTLLSVILLSNLFAILLQYLSLKLGIVTGRDLARLCRETFPKPISIVLWLAAEIMIIACDLAEVIGSAIALNLLFKIPLQIGILITAFDVFVLLALLSKKFKYLEAVVITLILTIIACFGFEIFFSNPVLSEVLNGFIPTSQIISNREMLYIAVGILGATVMPHNLYLHSSIVQSKKYAKTNMGKQEAIRFATIDSTFALCLAFFVNAAILIVAAATFHTRGYNSIAEIADAYKLLSPLVGVSAASTLFAFALLASGQNSTITATLAGQVIMEGFLHIKLAPWIRRVITRLFAIIPAIIVLSIYGSHGLSRLLILSQVVLSIQLSAAVFPLVAFTSSARRMGKFVNSSILMTVSYATAVSIAILNIWLIFNVFS